MIQATIDSQTPPMYHAYWGFKSNLAPLLPNNNVSGACGGFYFKTNDEPLENSNNGSMLYCPDEKTFAIQEDSDYFVLTPGSNYYWFAFWGIDDQSE